MFRYAIVLAGFIHLLVGASWVTADEPAVREMFDRYVRAFNDGKVDQIMELWSEDGVHRDQDAGLETQGKAQIEADLRAAFADGSAIEISGTVDAVRMMNPRLAIVHGEVSVSEEGQQSDPTDYVAIVEKVEQGWLIKSLTEIGATPERANRPAVPEPGQQLMPLQWLVGHWVDESDAGQVDTRFRWSDNKHFLIRSTVAAMDDRQTQRGTEVIAWDARSQQIRSWSFNSDGSFGDATWYQSGDSWVVKCTRSLTNGDAATGSYLFTPQTDDSFQLQLVGLEVEGTPYPSTMSVMMKRVEDSFTSEIKADGEADSADDASDERRDGDEKAVGAEANADSSETESE